MTDKKAPLSIDSPPIIHHRPTSISEDYEYAVYQPEQTIYGHSLHSPVTVVMRCHEGFEWNEALFVSEYRQGRGRRHKSRTRTSMEARIQHEITITSSSKPKDDRVLTLELTSSDKDILP
ncbi:uncharacterized protein BX664DRAFT_334294 [Halteromyces radiatus]|uniref:uncharacterized protein n=1 Tax=Halteromyces radiatus TaxID=101107 RepID=UPI0022201588|nr:uncharacterized protein BX664DRAFT_334294 [Halteromyces radiatus]KAI8089949.1 hypothetical protein BX664DRAFT_334294 [Halteromyces radiatus]